MDKLVDSLQALQKDCKVVRDSFKLVQESLEIMPKQNTSFMDNLRNELSELNEIMIGLDSRLFKAETQNKTLKKEITNYTKNITELGNKIKSHQLNTNENKDDKKEYNDEFNENAIIRKMPQLNVKLYVNNELKKTGNMPQIAYGLYKQEKDFEKTILDALSLGILYFEKCE